MKRTDRERERERETCFPLLQNEKPDMEYETTNNRGRELWFFTLVRWEGGETKDRGWKFCASSWGDLRAPPVVEVVGTETNSTSLAAAPLICCIILFPLVLHLYQITRVGGRRKWEPCWCCWWWWCCWIVCFILRCSDCLGPMLNLLFMKIYFILFLFEINIFQYF